MQRSWGELEAFYEELVEKYGWGEACKALGNLCRTIGKSHLGAQLFAHTSHACLVISQTETGFPPAPGHHFLRLTPDNSEIVFEIEHWATRDDDPWSRRVPCGELPAKFDKYLRQLGWNHHPISQ